MKELEVLLNNLEKDPNYKILKKKKEILKKDYIKRIKNIKQNNINNLFEFKINKLHTKSLKKNLVIEKNKNELQKRNNIKERTNLLKKIRDIERVKGERNIFIKNIIKHKDYNKGILDEEIGIINKLNNENIKIEKELDNNYKKKQIVIDNIIKNYKDLSNTKINLCKLKELFCKLKELLENKTDYLNELFENYKDKIIEYYDERKKNYYNEIDINIIFKNKIKYENEYIKSFIVNYINFLNELTSNFFSINNFYNIKNYIIYKSVIENEVLDYKNYKKDVKLLRNKCDEYYKLYLNDIDKKIEIGKKNFYKYICINFEEKDKLYRKNLLIKNYKILFKMKEDKLNKVNNYIKKYINN